MLAAVTLRGHPTPEPVEGPPEAMINILDTCEAGAGTLDCDLVEVDEFGVLLDPEAEATCAPYNGKYPRPGKLHGTMILSTIFAILMSFGIGANDAANQWGTPVGSGAIGISRAVMLGGFMEFLGAWALGYGVSKTVQKGVAKLSDEECWACGFCDSREAVYMQGMMGALIGASVLLLIASRYAVPLSTTHAIVGGVVGMTIAMSGSKCLTWKHPEKGVRKGLAGIVLSWVVSPLVAGIIGMIAYFIGDCVILKADNPVRNAQILAPVWYGLTTSVITMLCIFKTKPLKKLFQPATIFAIGGCVWVGITLVAWSLLVAAKSSSKAKDVEEPEAHKAKSFKAKPEDKVEHSRSISLRDVPVDAAAIEMAEHRQDSASRSQSNTQSQNAEQQDWDPDAKPETYVPKMDDKANNLDKVVGWAHAKKMYSDVLDSMGQEENLADYTPEQEEAVAVFRYCLVWQACLESFAHGANDTGNATAAFTAVYLSYKGGQHTCEPPNSPGWIMALGGLGVWAGIVCFGAGVIKTIGSRVTKVDYFRAFCIEFASTMSVVIATALEFPVSTTHCQIGALFFVGLASSGAKGVSFSLLGLIFLGWVLTLPSSGLISAAVAGISERIIG